MLKKQQIGVGGSESLLGDGGGGAPVPPSPRGLGDANLKVRRLGRHYVGLAVGYGGLVNHHPPRSSCDRRPTAAMPAG